MRLHIIKFLTVILLTAILLACSPVPLNNQASVGIAATNFGSIGVTGQLPDSISTKNSLEQKRSVYFDFDSYSVPKQYLFLIQAHAKNLLKNPQQRVQIQGNTGERGSTEYNLALGQWRAQAISEMLTLFGVTGNQIETISFGKEYPKATRSSKTNFAENRRADIEYQSSVVHTTNLPERSG